MWIVPSAFSSTTQVLSTLLGTAFQDIAPVITVVIGVALGLAGVLLLIWLVFGAVIKPLFEVLLTDWYWFLGGGTLVFIVLVAAGLAMSTSALIGAGIALAWAVAAAVT